MKSYTKKDFELTWFSGTGKGGQNRNKHQNCCRIKHVETGLMVVGQRSRDRTENLRVAFNALVGKLLALEETQEERRSNKTVVRTYHFESDRVTDHATGIARPVDKVMNGWIDEFVFNLARNNPRPESGRG